MGKELLFLLFFMFELFWSIGIGIYLAFKFSNVGLFLTFKNYIKELNRLNILGIVCFLFLAIASVPAIILGAIVSVVIYIVDYISENKINIFYKKEEV